MKIFFTVATYYPLVDGVQNITEFYAESLAGRGHQVSVLTGNISTDSDEEYKGVHIYRHNIYTRHGKYYGDTAGYIAKVKNIAAESDVMVNVCIQTATTDIILPLLDVIPCKKVLYMHGMAKLSFPNVPKISLIDITKFFFNNCKWKPRFKEWKKYICKYDGIIHLHKSDPSMDYLKELGIKNQILENGADFPAVEKKETVGNYWLCLSNFSADKNQELVLKSYLKSKTKKRMVFIGSERNAYAIALEHFCSKSRDESKKKNILFRYGLSREETVKYLKEAYGIISGSKVEKYPVIICEAMACGVPYISTNVGIVRTLPGGYVVSNRKEMTDKINELDKNQEKAVLFGLQGLDYARRNQNMENNVLKLESILGKVIAGENK